MENIPPNCSQESFFGFMMSDEDVGPGKYRDLAVEVKQLFEGLVIEADEKNEEIFLDRNLERALRRFIVDPSQPNLDHLLEVSPTLLEPFEELQALIRMVK